ncbi:MAG: tRNA 4-thiouridine(8) synthase ThiI [Firmicutes bacterium]|nr:tRNA 4-thiouridine(8) synthase ThiI [Bacillota bacterium]
MEDKVLIVKYGEIAMRGNNRRIFVSKLVDNIRRNIDDEGKFYVVREQGRLIVESHGGEMDFERIVPKVNRVLGILGVCPGVRVSGKNMEAIRQTALEHMRRFYGERKMTFKVVTKRSDKTFPLTSNEVSADVGGYIIDNMENMSVDVHNPDETLFVELRNGVYIYSKFIKGFGGLPYGSSGKGVSLLSGGIDSPVATFMMAKRGVEVMGVYFHSPPYTSERAKQKVVDLGKIISSYTGAFKLFVVPFTELQLYLLDSVPEDKLTIFLKRAMMRAAEIIARREKALALITGDSVGQVASQTMHGLNAINAACSMPVLRPLSGMDKQEIVDIAKNIGTFETSIEPYEDCCTIFVAKHPETKPNTDVINSIEKKLERLTELIENSVEAAEVVEI